MSIQAAEPPTPPNRPASMPTTPPPPKPAETVSEKYLRHIRNVVVAAFVIWIASAVIGGIAYIAVTVHDHNVAQQNACSSQGGLYIDGHCG